MNTKTVKQDKTYWVWIYLSGNIDIIKQSCRKFVMSGLCVTIESVDYIYTGGEESGVRIGLINYPRFPTNKKDIWNTAKELASIVRKDAYQLSVLLVDSERTLWLSDKYEE
jgi:hypothetical protein